MNSRRAIYAILVALSAASLSAAAAAQEPGESAAEANAEAVLEEAIELIGGPAAAHPTRQVTLVLAELSQVTAALDRSDRRVARSILARPDDGAADRYGDGFTVPEAASSPACDSAFCVHWVATTADAPPLEDTNGNDDGDGVPDYVEEVQDAAADSADVQNGTLGWTPPVGDGARGGGTDLTDAYLIETGGAYFGYSSPDEGQGSVAEKQAYLVLDDDMDEFDDPPDFTAIEAMQVTMAHEYNHVLQFAYDSLQDLWMFESTATWVEDYVYPDIDDYLFYLPFFAGSSTTPITGNDQTGLKIYGAAVWNHYLSSTYGEDAVREAWDVSDTIVPAHLSVAAYDAAIGGAGTNPFDSMGDEFARFASSTAEWRAQPTIYPDAAEHPRVIRVSRLVAGRPTEITLDHLSYALFKVRADAASDDLRLVVRAPNGTHFGADLVGRTGSRTAGAVTSSPISDDDGGRAGVVLPEGPYSRITAMVANADPRITGVASYARDNQRFRVRLARP